MIIQENIQLQQLELEIKFLKDQRMQLQHSKNKKIIELQCELEYERSRAQSLEQKYKDELQNHESYNKIKILTEKLTQKQNEMIEIMIRGQKRRSILNHPDQKKDVQKIQKLEDMIRLLNEQNISIRGQLDRVKQGAIQAILEKENVIVALEEQLKLKATSQTQFAELKDQFEETVERYQKQIKYLQYQLQNKKKEIKTLNDRLVDEQKQYVHRLDKLEQEINQKIQFSVCTAKANQDFLMENLESLKNTQSKFQSRNAELERMIETLKIHNQYERHICTKQIQTLKMNYTNEIEQLNMHFQEERTIKQNVIRSKQTQLKELRHQLEIIQTSNLEIRRKNVVLETERRFNDVEVTRRISRMNSQQRIKAFKEIQTTDRQNDDMPDLRLLQDTNLTTQRFKWLTNKEIDNDYDQIIELPSKDAQNNSNSIINQPPVVSQILIPPLFSQKTEDAIFKIQQLKIQLSNYQEQIDVLNRYIEDAENTYLNAQLIEVTRQLQQSRYLNIQLAEKDKRTTQQQSLLLQLQSLKQQLHKMESNSITEKQKFEEDLHYLQQKFTHDRIEMTKKIIKLTEEKSDLIVKIDRAKKPMYSTNSPIKIFKFS